jgi:2-polyprenyl-3-methyl-5-hydroxy-6-metoxy-1,4-benzoquinol methylase
MHLEDSQRPRVEAGCVGVDELEALAVRTAWSLVDGYERLGVARSLEAFGHEVAVHIAHAHDTVAGLTPWDGARASIPVYEGDNNRLRFRRTLDFVFEGEKVFDIGFGRGYLCGLLLRDRAVAAYHGIDVAPAFVKYVANMIEANGLDGDRVHVSTGDVYDLDHETVATTGADVVICCEVLEHLPDPEKALRTIADALPAGADLIFSVPLFGRLEAVWGHCTVFDAARLKGMCETAGLYVHHVEPLANTWTFVVASRDPTPSQRVRRAALSRPDSTVPLAGIYDFRPVPRAKFRAGRWVVRTDTTVTPASYGDVLCEIVGRHATKADGGQYGGVTFRVDGLAALRIRMELPDRAPVEEVFVELYDGSRRVSRWQWQPKARQLAIGKVRRFSFRPRTDTRPFDYHGTEPTDFRIHINRVEVFVRIRAGAVLSLKFGAAYLPSGPTPL